MDYTNELQHQGFALEDKAEIISAKANDLI